MDKALNIFIIKYVNQWPDRRRLGLGQLLEGGT